MSQPEQRVADVSSGTEVTPEQVTRGEATLAGAGDPGPAAGSAPVVDAEAYDPQHARSELAAETPPQPDAEDMEAAMRERGRPLVTDPYAGRRRAAATEDGPGTSLT